MAVAATKRRAKAPSKPIYLTCERLMRPETGEEIRAWVATTEWDARAMKARGYKAGTLVRAEFKRPRNPKFNKLAHAIGALLVDHCEGFEGMDAHDALKKAQGESGVCCERSEVELDLTSLGIGKIKAPLNTPQSIAFDSMAEEDFQKLVLGICGWIRDKFNGVPPSELSEIISSVEIG